MINFTALNELINKIIWGPFTLLLLIIVGFYFTVRTDFLQIKRLGLVFRETLLKIFSKRKTEGVSPAEALSTALAGTMGTGNIVGVATAIFIGGPGAIFWMWISALFGMMIKYAEVFLAVKYRVKNKSGDYVGGPMYYMETGLKARWLGLIFSCAGILASFGIGNMTQIHSVSDAMNNVFRIPPIATGIIIATLVAFVILGGAGSVHKVTKWVVPLMSVMYIAGAFFVIAKNIGNVPKAFSDIIKYAFTPAPIAGGFLGATVMSAMRVGISRGIFTNEAGMGSAPIAHAAADTDSPVRQGLWGIFEVFADTIIACTLTALVILTTGVWKSSESGAAMTVAAFKSEMGIYGGSFIAVSLIFFAFASILSWSFYGEKCLEYLSGGKFIRIYKYIYVIIVVIGSVSQLEMVWNISDTLNGLMVLPNIIAIVVLSGAVIKATNSNIGKL